MADYTKDKIENWVRKALLNPNNFYKKTIKELDSSGSVLVNLRDSEYNKWIIQELINNDNYKNLLDNITTNKADERLSYSVDRKNKKNYFSDKLTEKRLAICFYNNRDEYDFIGKRLHYETPIRFYKKTKEKEIEVREGAIDLVYQTPEYINLIELKSDTNDETLLRAILEICTYYKKLNTTQFYNDFKDSLEFKKPFQLALLLENSTGAYKDAECLSADYKKLLEKISNHLNCPIKIYGFKKICSVPFAIDNNKGKPILKETDFKIEELQSFKPEIVHI